MPAVNERTRALAKSEHGVSTSNPQVVVSTHAESVETSLRRVVRGEYHLLPLFVYQFLNYLQEGIPDVNDAAGFSQNVGLKGAHMLYVLQEAMRDTEPSKALRETTKETAPTDDEAPVHSERRTTATNPRAPRHRWREWCAMVLGLAAGQSQSLLLRLMALIWFAHLTLDCVGLPEPSHRWRPVVYAVVVCAYVVRGGKEYWI